MTARPRRSVLPVEVGTPAGALVVPVPLAVTPLVDPETPHTVGDTVRVRVGDAVVEGVVVEGEPPDAAVPPLTGAAVAALPTSVLRLVAEAWVAEIQRARRSRSIEEDRRRALGTALGQARVLRAVAGDVVRGRPTAADFDAATSAGLLVPPRLSAHVRDDALPDDPVARQLALGARVEQRVGELGDSSGWRSRSAFAGITTAAALILTGCSTSGSSGDRRCTDAGGRVVDDSNCRTYGGGGGGGYFYRYGGSTYSGPAGGTYVRGGSDKAPTGGTGFFGRSGGGS